MNAMALVQQFGKPDIFMIITRSPDWQEIKDNLKEGQTAKDRPYLVT